MTVTQLAPAASADPPLSAVCARRACSFCSETSATCGCSYCHLTCVRCFSECRRLYADSTCRACHEALTRHKRPLGTPCVVCHDTTGTVYVDPRIGPDPLCSSDHLRLWIIKTA